MLEIWMVNITWVINTRNSLLLKNPRMTLRQRHCQLMHLDGCAYTHARTTEDDHHSNQ